MQVSLQTYLHLALNSGNLPPNCLPTRPPIGLSTRQGFGVGCGGHGQGRCAIVLRDDAIE